jgi:hypothetical protein
VASEAQEARPARGAPVTGEQVPAAPATSQASHWPLQAALQQVPSAQKPLWHWFGAPQLPPSGSLGVQRPAEHQLPAAHWSSVAQGPAQAMGPQANGPQGWTWAAGHDPVPAQRASRVATPPVQEGERQTVVSSG